MIPLVGLQKDMLEYAHLVSRGVDVTLLDQGLIRRRDLLDAGFTFLNRIGAGEKPIINDVLPIPTSQGSIEPQDLGKRILLTADELGAVRSFQRQNSRELEDWTMDITSLRADMLHFLEECTDEYQSLSQKRFAAFRASQAIILDSPKYTEEEKTLLRKFFAELSQRPDRDVARQLLGTWMDECLAGVDLLFVRGIPIDIKPIRFDKLRNAPSPFLDSGFHFGVNHDVTLYPNDHRRTTRINPVVIHLLSRDINEMGASLNQSHDQRYITAGEYARNILKAKEDAIAMRTRNETNAHLIAQRLLYRVKALSMNTGSTD